MKKLNIILVAVIVVAALVVSTVGSGLAGRMQTGFLRVVSPFLKTGTAVQETVGSMGKGLKSLDELEKENAELVREVTELRVANQVLRDMERENNRLRVALNYREGSKFRLVAAQVISRDASTWWNTIKINRGFEDGVETDQPVLTDVGLVGKTTTVGKNESIVLLISDETCKVAAWVEGSIEKGILSGMRIGEGEQAGLMELNFLTKSANLQPGQKVYTAGVQGGVFPSNILLGQVVSFQARALDGQAIIESALDLSSVEDVFVVVGAK